MSVIYVLLGLAIGYYINQKQINEVKENHRERIYEYKEAFSKGFQTKNGYEPYPKEEKPDSVVHDAYEEKEEPLFETYRPERWDD